MIDKELNKSEVDQAPVSEGASSEMESLRKGRRRFIKMAIVTAPVILTVASRPVWARNCSLSGQLSGNLSGPDDCFGEGCSPGFWKNHKSKWHLAYLPGKLFYTAFGVDAFHGATLGAVIDKWYCESPILSVFGFHAVAALQNAATAVKYDLTVDEVISDFASAYSTGDEAVWETQKNIFDDLNNQTQECRVK